jgi:hypothetical protein
MTASENQALSLGVVVDSTASDGVWDKAVSDLLLRTMAASIGVSSPMSVNVVFQIPGEWVAPEFSGVRTGRFSAAESVLMVQVAVPKEVDGDPKATLLDLLDMAIDRAEAYAKRKKIAPALPELHDIAGRLRAE